jgi:hypothetical protein
MRSLGATDEQLAAHRTDMGRCGQGSSHMRLLPNRKNLLRIDWTRILGTGINSLTYDELKPIVK